MLETSFDGASVLTVAFGLHWAAGLAPTLVFCALFVILKYFVALNIIKMAETCLLEYMCEFGFVSASAFRNILCVKYWLADMPTKTWPQPLLWLRAQVIVNRDLRKAANVLLSLLIC